MSKQENWNVVVESLVSTSHPFADWANQAMDALQQPFTFEWLEAQRMTFQNLLQSNASQLEFNSWTHKEVLHALKGLWDTLKRTYFREYFIDEVLADSSHYLNKLLTDLLKGIHSHEQYLLLEDRWNRQVATYCNLLADEFVNLAKLALSKRYTIEKNRYYDQLLGFEIQTSSQNPFYPFVHFIETSGAFDEEMSQRFEFLLAQVERLIFAQNEQYQRKLIAAIKPYVLKGKQLAYSSISEKATWQLVRQDILHHPEWVQTNQLLAQTDVDTSITSESYAKLMEFFHTSYDVRQKEMGYFDFLWIQKEFEKRLRFIEKRIQLTVENQFGTWLKEMRESRGLSFRQLGKLANVSSTYLNRLELGERKSPSIPIAKKIAQAFGVPFDTVARFMESDTPFTEFSSKGKPEVETDLIKCLASQPMTIGDLPLTKKKRQVLSDLLLLVTDKSFNPNHLPDNMQLVELVKALRKN